MTFQGTCTGAPYDCTTIQRAS